MLLSLVHDLLAIMDWNESSLSEGDVEHQRQTTDACPTFAITVRAMNGRCFLLDVPIKKTMSGLKLQIAERLEARSSDLGIVFQSQLVGDVDSERGVLDFGLGAGCVIQVVHHVRYVHIVVIVTYVDTFFFPWRRSLHRFDLEVPRNMPCAEQIKAEVMQEFNGERYDCVQKMTDPELFLLNYGLHGTRISLRDEDCLDDFPDAVANPYEVHVIDQTQCLCGTCDLSWMRDGWRCPQIWYPPPDSSSDSDGLLAGTSPLYLGEEPVLVSSESDGDAS